MEFSPGRRTTAGVEKLRPGSTTKRVADCWQLGRHSSESNTWHPVSARVRDQPQQHVVQLHVDLPGARGAPARNLYGGYRDCATGTGQRFHATRPRGIAS